MLQVDTWAICYINASTAQLTPACVFSSLNNLLPVVLIRRSCWEHLPHLPLVGQHPRRSAGQSLRWAQFPFVLSGLGTCSVVIYWPPGDEQSEVQYVLHFPPFNILKIMPTTQKNLLFQLFLICQSSWRGNKLLCLCLSDESIIIRPLAQYPVMLDVMARAIPFSACI